MCMRKRLLFNWFVLDLTKSHYLNRTAHKETAQWTGRQVLVFSAYC